MMSSSIVAPCDPGLRCRPIFLTTALAFNPLSDISFLKNKKNQYYIACNLRLGDFETRMQKRSEIKRNLVVCSNNISAEGPVPSGPPSSGHWKGWVVGIVFSVVIPLLSGKLGSLSSIKGKFDTALQSVENIVERVEKVAGRIENAAEKLLIDLPDGELKKAVAFVEHIAERAAQDADRIDDVIDKVQEEKKLDDCLDEAIEKAKESEKEIKEQK